METPDDCSCRSDEGAGLTGTEEGFFRLRQGHR